MVVRKTKKLMITTTMMIPDDEVLVIINSSFRSMMVANTIVSIVACMHGIISKEVRNRNRKSERFQP